MENRFDQSVESVMPLDNLTSQAHARRASRWVLDEVGAEDVGRARIPGMVWRSPLVILGATRAR